MKVKNINPKIKKYHLDSYYLIQEFSGHSSIKDTLISKLNTAEHVYSETDYYSDNVNTDWHLAENRDREWVKYIFPYLHPIFNNFVETLEYKNYSVNQLWYQHYDTNKQHGWHTHGSNFTGVYYVHLPEDTPKTQLINPYTQSSIILPDIKEGVIILFPSYVVHRAPKVDTNNKIIISFNIDILGPGHTLLNKIRKIDNEFNR